MHRTIEPKILYFGTPVVLISTRNKDGTSNLAPMSSAWWLDQSCMLGMGSRSQTAENLLREKECVLNIPSAELVDVVDRLALTTGKNPIPEYKLKKGFQYVPDKFSHAGLTPAESKKVLPPRVMECTVQLEAVVERVHEFSAPEDFTLAFEVRIVCVHIDDFVLNPEKRHYIDADKWRPLIMNFCEFYGLGENLHPSRLAKVF